MLTGDPAAVSSAVSFRVAGTADVARVVEIVESAYRGDSSRLGWTTEADLLGGQRTDTDQVRSLIERAGSIVLLAELHGDVVGTCHLERQSPETAYFGMFAVRPGLQGGGIGRSIIAQATRLAATWGCGELRMTVIRQREDLIAWYARLGYLPTGETVPFPYGNERFGRPKREDLEFVVLSGPVPPTQEPAR